MIRAMKFIIMSMMLWFVSKTARFTNSTLTRTNNYYSPALCAFVHYLNFHGWFMEYFIILSPCDSSDAKETCRKTAQRNRHKTILIDSGVFENSAIISSLKKASHPRNKSSTIWHIKRKFTFAVIFIRLNSMFEIHFSNSSLGSLAESSSVYLGVSNCLSSCFSYDFSRRC